MRYLDKKALTSVINRLSEAGVEFLFLVDFKGERGVAVELSQLSERGIYCAIDGVELGSKPVDTTVVAVNLESAPILFAEYKRAFDAVQSRVSRGESYLLNLTFATPLCGDLCLSDIYRAAQARYKFMADGEFVFYSPEPFVKIENGRIYSFPMKGTILASEVNAAEKLLNSDKELREHNTIVDLIRNDLAMVGTDVQVEEFRYVEAVRTARGDILQTSSRISAALPRDWPSHLGDILMALLPAGSVSGAPKERTVEIIEQFETSSRGFYTGIMGVCREGRVDSCVNIRYVERATDGNFSYRSGGGITSLSLVDEEYQELQNKIYVPTF